MKEPEIENIKGKYYTNPKNNIEYGSIRLLQGKVTTIFKPMFFWKAFSEDDCGNYFIIARNGKIGFWDHETDKIDIIAESYEDFIAGCKDQEEVILKPGQVISVWTRPGFKPEFD